MTDTLPVVRDESALELDPVGYMQTVLHRAKGWLQEAQSIDEVRNAKAIAVGYESIIREKEMAFDAQLTATELVRRCERRVGELVREGQERGEIRSQGQPVAPRNQYMESATAGTDSISPRELFSNHKEQTDSYALADTPPEDFEAAIEEARAESNLSRNNVVRKVSKRKILNGTEKKGRSEVHRKTRHIDPNRIVRETVTMLAGIPSGLELVEIDKLDLAEIEGWIASFEQSIRTLTRFKNRMKETIR